jgi:hypothetical protein
MAGYAFFEHDEKWLVPRKSGKGVGDSGKGVGDN